MNNKITAFIFTILLVAAFSCRASVMLDATTTFATETVCSDYPICGDENDNSKKLNQQLEDTKKAIVDRLTETDKGFNDRITKQNAMYESQVKFIRNMTRDAMNSTATSKGMTAFLRQQDMMLAGADQVEQQLILTKGAAEAARKANCILLKTHWDELYSDMDIPIECEPPFTVKKIGIVKFNLDNNCVQCPATGIKRAKDRDRHGLNSDGNKSHKKSECHRKKHDCKNTYCYCNDDGTCFCNEEKCPNGEKCCCMEDKPAAPTKDKSEKANISSITNQPLILVGLLTFVLILVFLFERFVPLKRWPDEHTYKHVYNHNYTDTLDPRVKKSRPNRTLAQKLENILDAIESLKVNIAILTSIVTDFLTLNKTGDEQINMWEKISAIRAFNGKIVSTWDCIIKLGIAEKTILKAILKILKDVDIMPVLSGIDYLFKKHKMQTTLDLLENMVVDKPSMLKLIKALQTLDESMFGTLFNIIEKLSQMEAEVPGFYDIMLKELP